MQKLKEKELQQLKIQEEKIKQQYKHALDSLLHQESIKILVQFCKQQLMKIDVSRIENINDFSPVSISRLIFLKQLKQIKKQITKLPNKKCPLDHFLLLMLKIIKFPFQKSPLYLLGLKQMFKQIKGDQRQQYINYQQIQNYVMGQVVNFTDQTQLDTQFEIQFTENKMQDFLMHDNGVKKIHYSNDLKKYIILDEGSNIIKIYDQRMKIVSKFQPNKEKHHKKHPNIITFDYNELGSKLAISLTDNTFSIINLANFLQSTSQQTFRSVFLNQVCYNSSSPIIKIQFLSMMNKWLCIDQSNQIYIYDVQKFKQQNQNYCKKFKHPNDDYEIKEIIEIVSLAAVCFVINNQIWFFNQTLSKKKFKKFAHCEEITRLMYVEERNMFVLVGKEEKYLTMFNLNKVSGEANKIWTYQTNQIISDFAVFPFLNSILILDVQGNLKVYNQNEPIIQFQQNYQNIIKKKDLKIKLVKSAKNQFLIHATYILVMQLKKVAIQRDMDFNFLDTFYYDTSREQITFSVNGQILGIALMHGQVRKNIANQNSNLQKHKAFYMGKNTQLFVIDQKDSLFQVYSKNDQRYKENKDHRKAVGIVDRKMSFYDQQTRMAIMISQGSIYIVRNDGQNNFTLKSCLLFENSPHFIKRKYCSKKKYLIFLDANNTIYLMNSLNYQIIKILKINVFKQVSQATKMIIDVQYEQNLDLLMILTNNGQFAVINVNDSAKNIYIKMRDILPHKLQALTFNSFVYQKRCKFNKESFPSRVYFNSQTGWMIQLELENILFKVVSDDLPLYKDQTFVYIKDTHQINFTKVLAQKQINEIKVQKQNIYKPQVPKQANFTKVHDKAIVFARRIMLEDYYLLTIGEDGHIKLWGQKRKLYFDLKLPLVLKIQWNMNQLHQKRNNRLVTQTRQYLQKITHRLKYLQDRQILNINNHKKKLRNKSQKIKINLDNPIQIQFQNKDIQQIVMNNKQFNLQNMTIDVVGRDKNVFSINQRKKIMSITQRIGQPWRKKKQFAEIYQKASPVDKYVHKYKQKMPRDLLIMRNDLRVGQNIPTYRTQPKPKQQKLTILPQLKNYLKNYQLEKSKQIKLPNPEQNEHEQDPNVYKSQQQNKFQSCLFVKTERGPKKANAFDQIDKYFNRKQQQLLNKRWIPNKKNLMKKSQTLELDGDSSMLNNNFKSSQLGKVDPVKSVIKIFQEHNKQAIHVKKGRIIKIPYLKKQIKNLQKKNL